MTDKVKRIFYNIPTNFSEFEVKMIDNIFVKLMKSLKGTVDIDKYHPLDSNEEMDLLICFSDSDIFSIVKSIDSLPLLLVIEFPGDNSFFSDYDLTRLDWCIEEYITGNILIERHRLMQVEIDKSKIVVLNDILLSSSRINHRIRYDINIDGRSIYSDLDNANSILISSPIGSTAMALNVGGAIVHTKSDVFQIQSIASRNLLTSHNIVSNKSIIKIEIIDTVMPLVISLDNYQIQSDQKEFIISLSPKELRFLKFRKTEDIKNTATKIIDKISFEDTQTLTSSAKFILHVLRTSIEPLTINDIIETTHIHNQKTIRSSLKRLIQKGFVKRKENLQDMREHLYYFNEIYDIY
ncbi:MAG: winged helix DNA-binding protein [Candidatus Heimdallarchaeota archaeon]|nr:winged helix DNA-binding protein [Candidatus Heimdallarchaeota archaeon]MDH5645051.1 winged helix DNA-binding protein [Candidatus Heimdallarchaeota archaeon]